MIQLRAMEKMAEAHRHDLAAFSQARTTAGNRRGREVAVPRPEKRSAAREEERRSVGLQIGNWLIRAGTRLGGASMQAG